MPATSKYDSHRSQLKNGDLVLFRGTNLIAKLIIYFDKTYYSHCGMVFESNKRFFILDSNANGVEPGFLSERMKEYADFCIVRASGWNDADISTAVSKAMARAEYHIKYDFLLLLQIAFCRKTGIRLFLNRPDKDVCSEFARRYLRYLVPPDTCYENIMNESFITPWDLIIYKDDNFTVLFDDSDKTKFRTKK